MDHRVARRRRKSPICRAETGLRGPLRPASRDLCKGPGSAISPRSLQPVLVESVLNYTQFCPCPGESRGIFRLAESHPRNKSYAVTGLRPSFFDLSRLCLLVEL